MSLAETWKTFSAEIGNCDRRLISEIEGCWESVRDLAISQLEAFRVTARSQSIPRHLDGVDSIFADQARMLLLDPIGQYRRARPQQRALRALENWERTVEDVIRAMPEFEEVSGREWIQIVGPTGMNFISRLWLGTKRKKRLVPFRQNLLEGFQYQRSRRVAAEGRLLHTLAETSLELITPWQAMLSVWLPPLLPEPQTPAGPNAEIAIIERRLAGYRNSAARALADFQAWTKHSAEKIANHAPFTEKKSKSEARMEKLTRKYFRYRDFWVRQSRAVESDIDLELALAATEKGLIANSRNVLAAITKEHTDLIEELNGVVAWLEEWKQEQTSAFPPAVAEIVAAANRLNSWMQSNEGILLQVPESLEVSSVLAARPRLWRSWTTQAPRKVLLDSLRRQSVHVIQEGLHQLERQHQSIVREIERAREVVAFASETARTGKSLDLQVEREGIENARAMLDFHRKQTQDVPPEVERSLVSGLSSAFLRTHTLLKEGQFGLARQIARHGLPAATAALSKRMLKYAGRSASLATQWSTATYREALVRVGWVPAPTTRVPHVVVRGHLTQVLAAEARQEQLPMIYQRLFRLAPVEDPRFLIGRQEEMSAFGDARTLWEQNRDAGVLVVGERGSGKTSLINCALQSVLSGLEVLRAEFAERLTTRAEMYDLLSKLLGVPADQVDVELQSKRHVIVLEELERTFLKSLHSYEAIRTLLSVISRSSRQNLWIVSTNYFSFRLLNAALRLDAHFSHRINAMAIDPRYLREAILMRHNLSGLRLRFAPPPEGSYYAKRFRSLTGAEVDHEALFFDALYRESGGVFRAAFALWQRYVDRAEGGILYMRHPAVPHYEQIVNTLNDLDLFTLAAILQHGSLTPRELSRIFRVHEVISGSWLDNLLARELIEPDPGRYGLRVVPEAGQIVRQTLFRRNMG